MAKYKRYLIAFGAFFAAILLILFCLIASESGSRWLLETAFMMVDGEVSAKSIEGSLSDRITLTELDYQKDDSTTFVSKASLAWHPFDLLTGTLAIYELVADGITVKLGKPKEQQEKKPFDLTALTKLPIKPNINKLLITNVNIQGEGQPLVLDKIQLSVKTEDNQVKFSTFNVASKTINITAKGDVIFTDKLPLNLQADFNVDAEANGLWQGNTTLKGDLEKLNFNLQTTSAIKFSLTGFATALLTNPAIDAKGNWQNLQWPITSKPTQIESPNGRFEIKGLLSDYKVILNTQLNQRYMPQAKLNFTGNGNLEGMDIKALELKSTTGAFLVSGKAAWGEPPNFDLTASGQQFNPGIILPQLPGNLNFNAKLQGKLEPGSPQITAFIDKLNGKLRGQSVIANGKFILAGDKVNVDDLRAAFGHNKLSAQGSLGKNLDKNISKANNALIFNMDMPALAELWPTLNGRLTGKGKLQGSIDQLVVKLQAEGKHLKLDKHQLEDFNLQVDYDTNPKYRSTINLTATYLTSGRFQIDRITLDGSGNGKRHDLGLELKSSGGNISAGLNGSLDKANWKGNLHRLNLTDQQDGLWMLEKTVPIRADKKPQGYDVNFDEACVQRQSSSLCSKGAFLANSDLNLQVIAEDIPSYLVKPFLPQGTALTTTVDANLDLQRRKHHLSGKYRVDTSPTEIVLTKDNIQKTLNLAASSLAGDIKDEKVSSNIDLNLNGNDFLRGNLSLDNARGQAISGHINANIADFSPIQAFAPQLSNLKGLLQADMGIQGNVNQPWLSGHIDLTNGMVDVGEAGKGSIGLRAIELHALASGQQRNRIQIQGIALPVALNKPGDKEFFKLNSNISLTANLQQGNGLSGDFRLGIPNNTKITIITKKLQDEIVLGASSLSGRIENQGIYTDLDVALTGQDYLRGKLHLDMANNQALSGQVTASVKELTIIEPFAPQLSNTKGLLKADATIAGTAKIPLVSGGVNLNKASTEVEKLGINVHDINLNANSTAFDPYLLSVKGSAKSGAGAINLLGTVGLEPGSGYPVKMALTGKDFEVAKLPEAQINVTPDLTLNLTSETKKLSGQIEVPKALLQIQEIPANAVKVSPDEIIIGDEKPEELMPPAPGIATDIDIILGQKVSFSGQGLQSELTGKLKVLKTGNKLATQGKVNMEKASYKGFGQQLNVRRGQFLFNGPPDNPWVDLQATRLSKNKKVTAVLSLTGQLKNPQTQVSSEPALPETEALAYLITGGSLSQVSKQEGNMLASAALSYGAGEVSWLADKIGINEFAVQEGNTLKDTLLVMGQYLTPDFYIGTKIGLFNKQANLVLKHRITEGFNVETQTGTSQRIKLNYEFDNE